MATEKLSKGLGTEVSIRKVSLSLFNSLNMEGTMVRDQKKDTLLYAGNLKVRITDWFFLKDSAVLKYIGLENAVIKLNRKDSVWNTAYLVDYFSSPTPSKKKGGGLVLNLKKIDLKNVRFTKNDLWVGERMDIILGSLVLDAENIDFSKKIFTVNSLTLDKPFVEIQSLKALRPDSLRHRNTGIDTGMYLNEGDITVRAGRISIHNGSFFIDGNLKKPSTHFDGSHIQMSRLNGTIQHFSFVKDTMRAAVNLSVKDRCGLELKKLKTDFRFTPQIMELANLDLQTNKSRLTNYYAMQFHDFNKDFADYTAKVIMHAQFRDAKVNTDDIAFFAPELKDWKRQVTLSGKFTGTVEDFTVPNLSASIGNTTRLNGALRMKGLPDINTTRIDFTKGTLQTNANDLGTVIPALKDVSSPNLAALGNFIYRGNFNGTIQNFVTAGTFSTQLGGVRTDISLKLPAKGDPSYTGALETTRFNIGKFLNDTALGLVDFKGRIVGSSFNINRLKTTLQGTASTLEYNGYTFTNIISLGTFQKKYFTGEVKIDDPNLDFTSTVEIDLSKDLPRFNIVGDLVKSNLKELKLTKDSMLLTGLLDVNFTGTNIDNFLGNAKFLNANIKSGKTNLSFDSLNLISMVVDSLKSLHLGSNDFNASIQGQFSIRDLPTSFQAFLTNYFPGYIKQPKYIPLNQHFSFQINTGNFEPYLQLLDKKINGFNDARITGQVDTRQNLLSVYAAIPTGQYDSYNFTGLEINGKGDRDTLSVDGNIAGIQISDSLRFPNTRFNISSHQDHSVVSIKTSADNTLNDANLQADVYTLTDGVRVRFRPSSFVLNEKKWTIEKSGEITARSNLILAENVKFTQGFQEITVETVHPDDGSSNNNLAVKLKNVALGDITSVFFKDPRLEGITSGTIELNDLTGHFNARTELMSEQFRIDNDSVGLVRITASYDGKTGKIPFTIQSPNDGYRFSAKGQYDSKAKAADAFYTDILLQNSKIDILHKFLGDIFSDIKGQATGDLKISGDMNAPDLLGHIRLKNAGMKVNYTQVYYTIDSADIRFTEEGIDFGRFTIHDRYHNSGTVGGKLFERGFKNMVFDFEMSSPKILLIDTKPQDNQQFYGKAIGHVKSMTLKGPETDARMSIIAESNDSSHIFIPNSVSRESGTADFIVFKQYGTEMLHEKNKGNFNLSVDLDLTADNKVTIDVILDELAGDVIKANGYGRLRIKAGTTEPLTMRGRYNIERGSYLFNLQNILRKPFELNPDAGNYIEWNGDPFQADIHIDAQYTAERISLAELVSNLNLTNPAIKGYRGDVYVIAQLREKLSRPKIFFKLDFPQGSPVKSDNEFNQYLARLEKDQNEILNQVAFLFLFNSFQPPGGLGSSAALAPYSITSLAYNTISQVLTKSVNKVMSGLLHKLTGDKSLRFDMGTSLYSSSTLIDASSTAASNIASGRVDRTRIDLKFGYAFANEKIIVTVGSDIDFNVTGTSVIQNGNLQWLPNVNIEFILSQDKKLRLIVFNKTSLDLSGAAFGRRQRQGVSISYRRDFETLFGRKEKDIEFKTPSDSTTKSSN